MINNIECIRKIYLHVVNLKYTFVINFQKMKKIFIPFLILQFINQISFGQDDQTKSSYTDPYKILNYKWLSPEAYKFQETSYLDVQNSIFYGRYNYSLPLYEIKIGGITIPITLSYSSGGLKVEEDATDVGLGWSLSAGGLISREVKGGIPDYLFIQNCSDSYAQTIGWGYSGQGGEDWNHPSHTLDQAPDEYIMNALGISDRFVEINGIMSLEGQNNHYNIEMGGDEFSLFKKRPCSWENTTEDRFKDIKKITVTTAGGLVMTFIPVEGVETFSYTSTGVDVSSSKSYNYTVWGLDRIIDSNSGRVVKYNYDSFKKYKKRLYTSMAGGANRSGTDNLYTRYKRRLKSIQWDGGVLQFNYNKTRDDIVVIENETTEKPDLLLSNVQVINKEGITVKKFCFDFGYFQTFTPTKPNDYRLKLLSVTEQASNGDMLAPNRFEYYDAVSFPSTESKSRDYWGYYNNSGATTLTPKLFFYPRLVETSLNAHPVNAYYPFNLGPDAVPLNTGVDRGPNEMACMTGMLKKVSIPTGGSREFEYELNEFNYLGITHKGGGLRLKKQKINDGVSSRELSYSYTAGFISRYPSFAYYSPFADMATNSDPAYMTDNTSISENSLFEPVLLNGAYVGYSNVEEIESNNGKRRYSFNSDTDVSGNVFDEVVFSLAPLPPNTPPYGNQLSLYLRTSDNGLDFPRIHPLVGQLKTIDYYDNNSHIIKSIKYDYVQQIRNQVGIGSFRLVRYGFLPMSAVRLLSSYKLKDWFIAKVSEAVTEYSTDGGKLQYSQIKYLYGQNNLLLSKFESEKMELSLAESCLQANGIFEYNQDIYYYSNDLSQIGSWFPFKDAKFMEAMSKATNTHQAFPVAIRKFKTTTGNYLEGVSSQKPISDICFHFGLYSEKVLNDIVSTRNYSSDGIEQALSYAIRISTFDTYGRPTLFKKGNSDTPQFASWMQAYDYPKCNGIVSENGDSPLYTSFEPNESSFDGSGAGAISTDGQIISVIDAPSGDYCVRLNYNINGNRLSLSKDIPKSDFTISFWYKGQGAINGGGLQGEPLYSETWRQFSINCVGNQRVDFDFDGDIYLDDFRVIPGGSQLQTTTYRGLVGTLSQADANGQVTRYRYDSFNRLSAMLDGEGNILKAYKYNYGLIGNTTTTITTSKRFYITYTPGELVVELDDHNQPLYTRIFDSGEIHGVIVATDGVSGKSIDIPINLPVSGTSGSIAISNTANRIAGVVCSSLRSKTFSNITATVEGEELIVMVENPNIVTDVSRFTLSVKQVYESPNFNNYGYTSGGMPSLTITH